MYFCAVQYTSNTTANRNKALDGLKISRNTNLGVCITHYVTRMIYYNSNNNNVQLHSHSLLTTCVNMQLSKQTVMQTQWPAHLDTWNCSIS